MERRQIRLDDQAERDSETIRQHHNLGSRSAAIRYALREVARIIEAQRYLQRYLPNGDTSPDVSEHDVREEG